MDRLTVFTGPDKYRSHDLKEGVNYIGRSSESGIIVPDLTVSRKHLKVIKQGARLDRPGNHVKSVRTPRPAGAAHLLNGLWQRLNMDDW